MNEYRFVIRFDVDDVAPGLVNRVMVAAINALTVITTGTLTARAGGCHEAMFVIEACNLGEATRTSEVACMAIHPLVADAYAFEPALAT